MKKIIAVVVLALVLSGCGSKKTEKKEDKPTSNPTQEKKLEKGAYESSLYTQLMEASDADEKDFEIENGVIKKYIGKSDMVKIPEKINGQTVTGIGTKAFTGESTIIGLRLADTITTVEENSFAENKNLKIFIAGKGLSELKDYSLYHSLELKEIYLNKDLRKIGAQSFVWCSSLEKVVIPGKTTDVHTAAFYNCSDMVNVYGVKGSSAEKAANYNKIPFREL